MILRVVCLSFLTFLLNILSFAHPTSFRIHITAFLKLLKYNSKTHFLEKNHNPPPLKLNLSHVFLSFP